MKPPIRACVVLITVLAVAGIGLGALRVAAGPAVTTPPEVVATYNSLADAILAVKATEANLVRSMLAGGLAHAQAAAADVRAAFDAGKGAAARPQVETLAALVAQLATEGDNAVGAVRKRLLEGGHHHNAAGEEQGIYEPGFVIVTRAAKTALLDASKALAAAQDKAAFDRAWAPVETTVNGLLKAR